MRQKIIELIKNHPEFAYKYNDFLAALTLFEWKYLLKNQPKLKKIAKNFFWGNFLLSKTIDDSILAQLKFSDWDYLIKDDSFLERCRKFQEGKIAFLMQYPEEKFEYTYYNLAPESWIKIFTDNRSKKLFQYHPDIIEMCDVWYAMEKYAKEIVANYPQLWNKFPITSLPKIEENIENFYKCECIHSMDKYQWFAILEKHPTLASKCPQYIYITFNQKQWTTLEQSNVSELSSMHVKSALFKL